MSSSVSMSVSVFCLATEINELLLGLIASCIHSSIHPSVTLIYLICLSNHLYICPPCSHPSVHLTTYSFIQPSIYPVIYLFTVFIEISICLVCPTIFLFFYQTNYLKWKLPKHCSTKI